MGRINFIEFVIESNFQIVSNRFLSFESNNGLGINPKGFGLFSPFAYHTRRES
jgi:hypothetical protein